MQNEKLIVDLLLQLRKLLFDKESKMICVRKIKMQNH